MEKILMFLVVLFFSTNVFATNGMPKRISFQHSINEIVEAILDEIELNDFVSEKRTHSGCNYVLDPSSRPVMLKIKDVDYKLDEIAVRFQDLEDTCEDLNTVGFEWMQLYFVREFSHIIIKLKPINLVIDNSKRILFIWYSDNGTNQYWNAKVEERY